MCSIFFTALSLITAFIAAIFWIRAGHKKVIDKTALNKTRPHLKVGDGISITNDNQDFFKTIQAQAKLNSTAAYLTALSCFFQIVSTFLSFWKV